MSNENLTTGNVPVDNDEGRGQFGSQLSFILAAVGSAVGLGNIWRFPYIAYDNGGGSFIVPYLIALFTAGIPFLLFDYAIGHRFRASAPLSFRRLSKATEFIGWWAVLVCAFIGTYYSSILAWAGHYTIQSFTKGWGDDPSAYFFGEFLGLSDDVTVNLTPNLNQIIPILVVWVVIFVIMIAGVERGIGKASVIMMPLLVVMFVILVVIALTLPGAQIGLDALMTPNWEALKNPTVWVAAYGQIFFSLSIGFGIMVTYSSYVGRKTNMTGPGVVTAFANSSFELLAGIAVFATLGFMAQAQGVEIDEVVASGLGLAFVTFPAIINQAPAGELIGVLFFTSLLFAGVTSLVSISEVVVAAVRDKTGWGRTSSVAVVVVPSAIISVFVYGSATGLYALDTVDAFINTFGILLASVIAAVVVSWIVRRLPVLRAHLNKYGSVRVGMWWQFCMAVITPVILSVALVMEILKLIGEPYGGYPVWYVATFGWGAVAIVIIGALLLSKLPWRAGADIEFTDRMEVEANDGHFYQSTGSDSPSEANLAASADRNGDTK